MPATALKQAPIAGVAVPIATLALVGIAIALARPETTPWHCCTKYAHLSRL